MTGDLSEKLHKAETRIKELEKEVDAAKMKSGYVTYMESQIRIDELEAKLAEKEDRIKELEEQLKNQTKESINNSSNDPKEAYAVVLKMMDSHCLVGGKIFIKETDAEKFNKYATHKAQRLFDIVKVKIFENYDPPKD